MYSKPIYLCVHVGYNASCAIMVEGEIVAAAQEERFTRKKNETGFPSRAIDSCLNQADIEGRDVTMAAYTTIYEHPWEVKAKITPTYSIRDYHGYYNDRYYAKKFAGETGLDYLQWLRDDEKFNHPNPVFDFSFLSDELLLDPTKAVEPWKAERRRVLASYLGIPEERVTFLDHHTCHANYSYFASHFRNEDCAVVVLDGWGDKRNQTVWMARGNRLELIAESNQNDIGHTYKMATLHLGMRPDEHEFKVMGLAPYAKDDYVRRGYELIKGINKVEKMRIVHDDRPADLYNHLRSVWLDQRFDNIAGAIQLFTEKLACKVVENIHAETGIRRFAMGGGVAMNIKMNMAISELDCVGELFVPGSGSDESLAIGGCYLLNVEAGTNHPLDNLYLGYDSNRDLEAVDWEALARDYGIVRNVDPALVADKLIAGDVVARIDGRCEFGARALGNRSILADPSRRDAVEKINEAIKNRDFWMPFAVSILAEKAGDYVDNPKDYVGSFHGRSFPYQAGDLRQDCRWHASL